MFVPTPTPRSTPTPTPRSTPTPTPRSTPSLSLYTSIYTYLRGGFFSSLFFSVRERVLSSFPPRPFASRRNVQRYIIQRQRVHIRNRRSFLILRTRTRHGTRTSHGLGRTQHVQVHGLGTTRFIIIIIISSSSSSISSISSSSSSSSSSTMRRRRSRSCIIFRMIQLDLLFIVIPRTRDRSRLFVLGHGPVAFQIGDRG